ncbi:iron-sulfur cluster repair di-iron protein [Thalassospira mesophila]|uniref:Hemerythrin-like domain-containing protein n=1 Tax=Thalassospira mesophila TaxID=1293891 RepID=A0A1Y2KW75_9PROT|nr:iron-sulfur cluster repair di-iron protein [Thalassospira mesophila]OSQ36029.1 hypothetical protein TMES_19450 [Thalassospira mesophila]
MCDEIAQTSGITEMANRPVAELVALIPGATRVFRHHRINFCCHGDAILKNAVLKRGADIATVEAELRQLAGANPLSLPVAEDDVTLIAFILDRYHEAHRAELPDMIALARKVETVHGDHPDCPLGLAVALEEMAIELDDHMAKEETVLFPAMYKKSTMLLGPILQMRVEHETQGEYLHRLEALTNHLTLPDGACRSWQRLYRSVEKLIEDLVAHIYLENRVLFPRFES